MGKKVYSWTQRHDELVKSQMRAYEMARQRETRRIIDQTGLPYEVAYRQSERAVGGTAGNNNYVWPFMDD
jgi:hypothetical protein